MICKAKPERPAIARASRNVFADLGFKDADEQQTKLRLAYAINGIRKKPRSRAVARISVVAA